jgi:hypothetical protein
MKPKPYKKYVNVSDKASIGKGSNKPGVRQYGDEINPAATASMRTEELKNKHNMRLVLMPYDDRFGNMYTKGDMQYNELDGK